MSILRACAGGFDLMARHSRLVLVIWLLVWVAALPAAVAMGRAIQSDIGTSRIYRQLETGLDLGWLEEFAARQGELGELLEPVKLTGAMWLGTIDLWFSGGWVTRNGTLAILAVAFLLLWLVCQGGILAQLAKRERRFSWRFFLGSGGQYWFRFGRIALLMGLAYFAVYRLGRWLFPAIQQWTRDWTTETSVLTVNMAGATGIVALLSFVHLTGEYARIAVVRQERRSIVLALFRSVGLIVRHPLQVIGLALTMVVLLLTWQVGYFLLAPGVEQDGALAVILAIVVGQIYLLGRWGIRIARFGAELHLFDLWTASSSATRSANRPSTHSRPPN